MHSQTVKRVGAARTLARELASLPDLSTDELKERWRELYGAAPPPRLGQALLVKGSAYRMQQRALGGLKPATRRRLAAVAEDVGSAAAPAKRPTIKPGTRLLREWQGVTHEVIVAEEGVLYRGETWRSLSAVARKITGTRWSGPAFFGLKGRRDGR